MWLNLAFSVIACWIWALKRTQIGKAFHVNQPDPFLDTKEINIWEQDFNNWNIRVELQCTSEYLRYGILTLITNFFQWLYLPFSLIFHSFYIFLPAMAQVAQSLLCIQGVNWVVFKILPITKANIFVLQKSSNSCGPVETPLWLDDPSFTALLHHLYYFLGSKREVYRIGKWVVIC